MRKITKKSLAIILALAMIPSANISARKTVKMDKFQETFQAEESDYAEGQAIILYSSTTKSISSNRGGLGSDMEIVKTYEFDSAKEANSSISSVNSEENSFSVSLVKSDQYSTEELITKLSETSGVLYAEPNYKIHTMNTDPYKKYQWAVENTGQNGGTPGLDIKADSITTTSDEEKVIALIDTGIDYNHEDLGGVVWNNPYNSKKLAGKHGYDFISYDNDPMDDNGHGTHCAGIMKANEENGIGIQGICQNANIKIMALKILDDEGSGYEMEAVGAYNYIYKAQQLGTNIVAVNNSWGGADDEESAVLKQLIDIVGKQGALSICAAGNEGVDNDQYETLPANIDSDYIVSVAASNEKDELVGFSNYGKKTVDIAAPGANILSTVSYNAFAPYLYEKPSGLMSLYEPFDELETLDDDFCILRDDGFLDSAGSGESSLQISDEEFFGAEEGKSLEWTIKGAKRDEVYYLDIPFDVPKSKTDIYAGITIKAEGPSGETTDSNADLKGDGSLVYIFDNPTQNGEVKEELMGTNLINGIEVDGGNYWNTIYHSTGTKKQSKRCITVVLTVMADGDYTIYMDDMAVSAADISSRDFGKYDMYNGTSMATPCVSAAVAMLSDAYPEESAIACKERLLGCTRKTATMKGKVASEGILDLSNAELPHMMISKLSFNTTNRQMEVYGSFLSGAKIYVNDTEVTSEYDESKGLISFDASAYINNTVTIKIAKGEYEYSTEYFIADGKKYDTVTNYFGSLLYGGEMVSDGNALYYINSYGIVSSAAYETVVDENKKKVQALIFESDNNDGYDIGMFGDDYKTIVDYSIYSSSNTTAANQTLYQILTLDLGYSVESVLASYSDSGDWKMVATLPEEVSDLEGITLAMHNGVPYLLGGFNPETAEVSDSIYKYDSQLKKWTSAGKLPEKRAYAKAIQTGKELVVTLGTDGTENTPKNIIYDGNKWTLSKANLGEIREKQTVKYNQSDEEKELPVTTAQTGLIKDGIIYTGINVEGMGDTFTYTTSKDQFNKTSYSLENTEIVGDTYFATTWGNKLYVLSGDTMSYYDDYDDDYALSKKQVTGYDDDDDDDDDYDDLEESSANVYTIPVADGMMHINEKSNEIEGYIEGAGGHLPGDTIVLTAKIIDYAKDYAYVSGMVVDGKKIKANSKGKYTYTVTNLAQGQTINASMTVAFGKQTNIPKKGTKFKKGAFTYKVTKASKKNGTVTIVSYNKKKKGKTAKIPATIKKNGYIFKVNAISNKAFKNSKKLSRVAIAKNVTKIGKSAFENCKKLKKVIIKSLKIKSFGKGLFKKTNKKIVVKVPKKKLKAYQKKLKKAGYKGKIK